MKEKISMIKLTEKQEQALKGGVVYSPCVLYTGSNVNCTCYILNGHCATQLWPTYPQLCIPDPIEV